MTARMRKRNMYKDQVVYKWMQQGACCPSSVFPVTKEPFKVHILHLPLILNNLSTQDVLLSIFFLYFIHHVSLILDKQISQTFFYVGFVHFFVHYSGLQHSCKNFLWNLELKLQAQHRIMKHRYVCHTYLIFSYKKCIDLFILWFWKWKTISMHQTFQMNRCMIKIRFTEG